MKNGRVSIATINGSIKATFNVPGYYRDYINWEIRSSTLKYDAKKEAFFLHVIFRKDSPEPSGSKVLGIDRGIVNVAVCSNNVFFNGKSIKNVRGRYAFVRKQLHSKGTHLKKYERKSITIVVRRGSQRKEE